MTAAELIALAERVEGSMGSDGQLEHECVWALLPDHRFGRRQLMRPGGTQTYRRPRVLSSLDAVVSLIEQVLPEWMPVLGVATPVEDGPCWAYLWHLHKLFQPEGKGTSLARALLAALLRAKAAEVAG